MGVPRSTGPSEGGGSAQRRLRQRGQAIVEVALLAPLLTFLLLIVLDFGRVFHDYIAVVSAARVAAEVATNSAEANDATITAAALEEADGGLGISAPDVTIDPSGSRSPGVLVTVTVRATYVPLTPLISNLVGSSLLLQSEAKARCY